MTSALDLGFLISSNKIAKYGKEKAELLSAEASWYPLSWGWENKLFSLSITSEEASRQALRKSLPFPNLNLSGREARFPFPVITGEGRTAAHRPPFNHP